MKYISIIEVVKNPSAPIVLRSTTGETRTLAMSLNDLRAAREEKLERSTQRQGYKDELAICHFAAALNVYIQLSDEVIDTYYDDAYEPALYPSDLKLRASNFLCGPQAYIRVVLKPGTNNESNYGLSPEDRQAIRDELAAQRVAREKRLAANPPAFPWDN